MGFNTNSITIDILMWPLEFSRRSSWTSLDTRRWYSTGKWTSVDNKNHYSGSNNRVFGKRPLKCVRKKELLKSQRGRETADIDARQTQKYSGNWMFPVINWPLPQVLWRAFPDEWWWPCRKIQMLKNNNLATAHKQISGATWCGSYSSYTMFPTDHPPVFLL